MCVQECLSCHKICASCAGPTELECLSCREGRQVYTVEVPTTQSPDFNDAAPLARPHESVENRMKGQCVLCCEDDDLQNGECCDCSEPGNNSSFEAMLSSMALFKKKNNI